MPEPWTGQLICKMHNNGVTRVDLARELGVGKSYVTMILNSTRKPPNIQERMESAVDAIIQRKEQQV